MLERKLAAAGFLETDKLSEEEKQEARAKFAQKEVVWYNSVIVPSKPISLRGRLLAIARSAVNPAAKVANLVAFLWGEQFNTNWGLAAKFAACFRSDESLIYFLLNQINNPIEGNVIQALYPLAATIGDKVKDNQRSEAINRRSTIEEESLRLFREGV